VNPLESIFHPRERLFAYLREKPALRFHMLGGGKKKRPFVSRARRKAVKDVVFFL